MFLNKGKVQMILVSAASAMVSLNAHAFDSDYYYLAVEGGISIPQKSKINAPFPDWDFSPEGYNKKLTNSEVLGVGLGYHFCPSFSTELVLDHRNSYKYKKFQTSPATLGNKTRYFNLKNTTLMVNFIGFTRCVTDCLCYRSNNFLFDPFINFGIGVAYNTVENFHSLQAGTAKTFSMMSPYTKTNMAYQLGLGVQTTFCNLMSIGIGYRYLYTGNLRTNDYLIDNPDSTGTTSGTVTQPWKSKFKTNEFYIKFSVPFGC